MKSTFSLFLLLSLPVFCSAQLFPELEWQMFFDNHGSDWPVTMAKGPDSSLVIGGHTTVEDSLPDNCADIWILKISPDGLLLWEREVSMTGCEELRDLVLTDDGGVLFIGITNSLIPHAEKGDDTYWSDVLVGKLDSTGTVEWLQSYGGSHGDQAYQVISGNYSDYIIAGGTHSVDGLLKRPNRMGDPWTLKIDNRGQVRFSEKLGGSLTDWATAITQDKAGDYLLAGVTDSRFLREKGLGAYGNGYVARLSETGQIKWQRAYPSPEGGQLKAILTNEDGRIIVAGDRKYEQTGQDFWWMKLTSNGKLIREQHFPMDEHEFLTDMIACSNGGYLLSGYSLSRGSSNPYSKGGDDFWLLRVDEQGKMIWKKTYGGPDHERCRAILEFEPGVFYALGEKNNVFSPQASQDQDFWLLKISELPTDSIQADIYVRAKDFRINRDTPTRFRARYQYGERFLWDFGDGTTSTEEQPLKSYEISGTYRIRLTIFMNENCQQTVFLERLLEVW
ncbi:MAG: PKD domain-containing protein [Bacteroidota bacterium]